MPLVVGIDEAGYGPTLGPLVVGATMWNVLPRNVKADFWEQLADCVTRAGKRGQWRLVVNDSKAVYNRKKGISTLERPVLAFACAAGLKCETLGELLIELNTPIESPDALPWYRDLNVPTPLGGPGSKFQAVAERLKRVLAATGLSCAGLSAQVVAEDHFNRRVRQTRNKAAVLIEQVLRLIQNAGERTGGQDLIVRVDRLGGRSNYRALLSAAFPERHLHVIDASEQCSRYRLASSQNDWYIEFAVDADKKHLPVALASMLAKYLREALMTRFNAYWRARAPELKPTAGYYTDARRFLADLDAAGLSEDTPLERYVRER